MSQQCTPLWSPKLYALGVPSVWVVWVLLWWQVDYYRQSGLASGFVGCQAWPCVESAHHWLAGPGREVAGCVTPVGPGFSAGLLMGGVRVQGIPGLVLAHLWVKSGVGASASPLVVRVGSWGWAVGLKGPRTGAEQLVGGSSS